VYNLRTLARELSRRVRKFNSDPQQCIAYRSESRNIEWKINNKINYIQGNYDTCNLEKEKEEINKLQKELYAFQTKCDSFEGNGIGPGCKSPCSKNAIPVKKCNCRTDAVFIGYMDDLSNLEYSIENYNRKGKASEREAFEDECLSARKKYATMTKYFFGNIF
jgi:hypothetical protein